VAASAHARATWGRARRRGGVTAKVNNWGAHVRARSYRTL
jgi:hypothetical protein